MGCVAISWNGLAFTAAAETAGHARSGTAIGLQQTALAVSGSVLPIAFGAFVGADFLAARICRCRSFPASRLAAARECPGEVQNGRVTRIAERLEAIYAIGATRIGGSAEEDAAHALAAGWLAEAGLDVQVDRAGNTFGRRGEAALWVGSHLDSVPNGGRYDGALGVVAAIEAAERIAIATRGRRVSRRGTRLRRKPGLCGRSATAARVLGAPCRAGPGARTARAAARHRDRDRRTGAWRGRLRRKGRPRGYDADGRARGRARRGGRFVLRVRDAAPPGTVATVGQVEVEPGAVNVVPARVTVSVDARAATTPELDALVARDRLRAARTATSQSR